MTQDELADLISDRQKILLRQRTVQSESEVPPFAYISIFAVQDSGVYKNLEVRLNLVAKGNNCADCVDHPSKFTIALDDSQHLPILLLKEQIKMLEFGHRCSTVSHDEIRVAQSIYEENALQSIPNTPHNTSEPILITEDDIIEWYCGEYSSKENMIQATEMAFQAVHEDLASIFRQVKIAV